MPDPSIESEQDWAAFLRPRLMRLRTEIAVATAHTARRADAVQILAVSKGQPIAAVKAALGLGLCHFGENRVQEAVAKFTDLRPLYPALRLHLIGPLQSNKAARAVALCDVIATLDRPKIITAVAAACEQQKRWPVCLINVNLGAEPQKAGAIPAMVPDLLAQARAAGLQVVGLMGIPPQNDDPAAHFRTLANLADRFDLAVRSMGMSGDFAAAITAGATEIRLGTALFGAR